MYICNLYISRIQSVDRLRAVYTYLCTVPAAPTCRDRSVSAVGAGSCIAGVQENDTVLTNTLTVYAFVQTSDKQALSWKR